MSQLEIRLELRNVHSAREIGDVVNKKQREAVSQAWSIIDRAVDFSLNSTSRSLWSELNKETLEHEKQHRSMGRRVTDGRAGYKESVPLTAKFFAVRAVLRPHTMRALGATLDAAVQVKPISALQAVTTINASFVWQQLLLEIASVREDVLKGAMLRACLEQDVERDKNKNVEKYLIDVKAFAETIREIDYSKDIAVAA